MDHLTAEAARSIETRRRQNVLEDRLIDLEPMSDRVRGNNDFRSVRTHDSDEDGQRRGQLQGSMIRPDHAALDFYKPEVQQKKKRMRR